jgi:hypothetical protein
LKINNSLEKKLNAFEIREAYDVFNFCFSLNFTSPQKINYVYLQIVDHHFLNNLIK